MNLHRHTRSLLLCALLPLAAACSSQADRLQSGLVKGEAFVRTADWDKASVEVRNVLQIDPKNATGWYLGGQIAEGRRDVQRAYGSYLKAVELKPDFLDAKVGLARIYLLAGESDKARKTIDEILVVDARHGGARTLKAALLARSNDVEGAIREASALLAEAKTPPIDTSMLLAGLYSSQGNGKAALEVVEAALQANPKNVSLLQVGAQIAAAGTDEASAKKAADLFRQATAETPKNNELWGAWAAFHMRRAEPDAAEAVLRAAVKAQPDDSARGLALLEFLAQFRGREVAEKAFLAAVSERPKDMPLRFGLASFYRATERPADARRVLEEVAARGKDTPDGVRARDQLAAESLGRGQIGDAKARVADVLKSNPRDGAALVLRARMLLADGDARAATLDLRAAARDDPGSVEIAGLLAQAHRRAGEPLLAREVLSDAVKFKPSSIELRLLLAADMADAKDWKAAESQLDAALKIAPLDVRVHDMKAQLALARNDTAGAAAVYAALKASAPADPAGSLRLGRLYADQKRYELALKEYDNAALLASAAPEPKLYAIGVLIAQKRYDEAGHRIEAWQQREPKNVLPLQLRGDLALARGDLPRAADAYAQLVASAPAAAAGYQSLARVRFAQNQPDAGYAALAQGEKALPGDTSLAAAKAESQLRSGRSGEAIATYEAILKRQPDDDAAANNLAYLLSGEKADKASLERALALATRFQDSNNPTYLDTLGWTRYRLGQYDLAVPVLERAVERANNAPLLQLHLGLALHKKGDVARAQEFLKKAAANPNPPAGIDEAKVLLSQR